MKFFYFIVNFIIQFFLTVIFGIAGIKDINIKSKKQPVSKAVLRIFLLGCFVIVLIFIIYYYISKHSVAV